MPVYGFSDPYRRRTPPTEQYVDPDNGYDYGIGDALHPLRTLSEAFRRLQGYRLTGYYVIFLLGDTTEDVSYDLFVDSNVITSGVTVQGTRTLIRSGGISSIQSFDSATWKNQIITDSSLPVSWTASGLVGGLVVLNANYTGVAWVLADLGSKQAVISPFIDPNTYDFVDPAAPATSFGVYSLTKIGGSMCGQVRGGGFVQFIDCDINNIDENSYLDPLTHTGGYLYLTTCHVNGNDPHPSAGYGGHLIVQGSGAAGSFTSCYIEAHTRAFSGGQIRLWGCGFTRWGTAPTADERNSSIYVDGPCSGYGEQTMLQARNSGKVEIGSGAWYAQFNQAVGPQLWPGAEFNCYGLVWGSGITTMGMTIDCNSTMVVYTGMFPSLVNNPSGPTLPTTQVQLGGTSVTYSTVAGNLGAGTPTLTQNTNNGARIVPFG